MSEEVLKDDHTLRDHLLSDSTYDSMKNAAQLGIPALGTFYFTLSQIWGLPYGEEVVGTLAALNTLLGVILRYSSKSYARSEAKFDGTIDVEQVEGGPKRFTLNLNGDPETLDSQSQVVFKINSQ